MKTHRAPLWPAADFHSKTPPPSSRGCGFNTRSTHWKKNKTWGNTWPAHLTVSCSLITSVSPACLHLARAARGLCPRSPLLRSSAPPLLRAGGRTRTRKQKKRTLSHLDWSAALNLIETHLELKVEGSLFQFALVGRNSFVTNKYLTDSTAKHFRASRHSN